MSRPLPPAGKAKTTGISLAADLIEDLNAEVNATGKTRSLITAEALRVYIARAKAEREAQEAFLARTRGARR